ncbi:ribonuclease H-like domain-containing protein [Suillus paluster]|uniref:ribonuclease H-like domain-containing protein n=1 Tax=Suillus paluster TaxID=48578 RepID=UPI001B85E8DF|nr:ribonuclease H-like domain-containing protein [Suillus paluster]KAG1755016.1 ribonuclease H-like domain-containing protein [Suillus paluster]
MPGNIEGSVGSGVPRPELPRYSWRVESPTSRLQYIRDHRDADIALSQLTPGPLGFDLEWRPNYRKGAMENRVALVQLAGHDSILLLQVSAMSEFPSKLRELLDDPSRPKAGVSIQRDCQKLFRDHGVSTRNCVELALLARSVDNARWKGKYTNPLGLSRLLENYENFSLAKGKVQRSNWEVRLSPVQQDYAANDARAGYTVYTRLIALARDMPNTVSPDYYSFSVVNGSLLDHLGVSEWFAQNPHYDPGPPPPPKEPKERKKIPEEPTTSAASHTPASSGSHFTVQDRVRIETVPRDGRGPPLVPPASANSLAGKSYRNRSYRNRRASTKQPQNHSHDPAQQSATIAHTAARTPGRSTT